MHGPVMFPLRLNISCGSVACVLLTCCVPLCLPSCLPACPSGVRGGQGRSGRGSGWRGADIPHLRPHKPHLQPLQQSPKPPEAQVRGQPASGAAGGSRWAFQVQHAGGPFAAHVCCHAKPGRLGAHTNTGGGGAHAAVLGSIQQPAFTQGQGMLSLGRQAALLHCPSPWVPPFLLWCVLLAS